MNRQERRRMEKLNKKQTVRMTPDRIQEVKDTISEKVSKYASQQMMITLLLRCIIHMASVRNVFSEHGKRLTS